MPANFMFKEFTYNYITNQNKLQTSTKSPSVRKCDRSHFRIFKNPQKYYNFHTKIFPDTKKRLILGVFACININVQLCLITHILIQRTLLPLSVRMYATAVFLFITNNNNRHIVGYIVI